MLDGKEGLLVYADKKGINLSKVNHLIDALKK
jgi:hypothetical protein